MGGCVRCVYVSRGGDGGEVNYDPHPHIAGIVAV